ncbi:hypothetical protein Agabi119p4_5724 [Agaricus bisporus var. burnettii]|uniref:Nicotinamide-nucleotide adenylyltransferase n=1 Tax=Agaricus bisporus var. burnettii TaxID=192524 RepID=A0A8H7F2A6_AGABI|nr:hypothetical protein Agabi119p4_5724 [Agaricus bisporus var. burnettii]
MSLSRVQHGLSRAELVHVSHPRWPLPLRGSPRLLRISVLDASFNPPTLAHLALLNAPRPPENGDYDAKLLLLSVRNADKSLKPTDATYIQRLEMMHLLSQRVQPNVAIGVINEPTFVGKSTLLLDFLRSHLKSLRGENDIKLELSFILGLDTLERLIAPRYYPSEAEMLNALRRFLSPAEENSLVVCARRNQPATATSDDKLKLAKEFIDSGRVLMINIGDDESTYSSTAVRNAINEYGLGEEGRKSWGKYVPESIADYIAREKLYVG